MEQVILTFHVATDVHDRKWVVISHLGAPFVMDTTGDPRDGDTWAEAALWKRDVPLMEQAFDILSDGVMVDDDRLPDDEASVLHYLRWVSNEPLITNDGKALAAETYDVVMVLPFLGRWRDDEDRIDQHFVLGNNGGTACGLHIPRFKSASRGKRCDVCMTRVRRFSTLLSEELGSLVASFYTTE